MGIIFFIIAIGFHNSSLLLIPVLILAQVSKTNYKTYRLILISSIILCFSISSIEIIMEYSNILSNIDFLNCDRWMWYNEIMAEQITKNINGLLGIILPSSFFALFVIKNYYKNYSARVFGFAVAINNILCVLPNGTRAMFCLMAIITIYFPLLFHQQKNIKFLLVSLTSILIFYLLFVRMPYMQHIATNWFSPYQFA